ncbi:Tuberous sclerosis 2 protein-like protein [Lachnellula suecica]|uniref:Tuberous sclerosis 2 protein-like protein n=1 Tax=Lachnellula suecica TaxID=602035 RepID=A0A8T9BUF1_9HELO|nr:Tuberous sclerosis 2 protein-like protein [Lachnellula suecica]
MEEKNDANDRRRSVHNYLPSFPLPLRRPSPAYRVSMPPSFGGDAQTPEPKSTNGLVSVFKSLTGGKQSRSPNASAAIAARLNGASGSPPTVFGGPPNYEQLFEQLKIGNSLTDRLAAAEAIRHAVQDFPLSGVTSIFKEGKDLIEPTKTAEARVIGFQLLTACVQNTHSTDPERLAYFQVLTAPANPDDFHLQLASLVELAKHGRDLSGFHYLTMPLLTTWLRDRFQITTAAARKTDRRGKPKIRAPIGEETNLSLLFAFIVDVIKFSFNASSHDTAGELIDVVLYICLHTGQSSDLKACINVIDTIGTYGEIPKTKLAECVKVLCAIHCLMADTVPEAYRSITNLCRSHNGQTTVRVLLNVLRDPPTLEGPSNNAIREIRGALNVLERLFPKSGDNGYPLVPFTLLVHALNKVVALKHIKIEADVLRLILSLFDDQRGEVMQNVMEEDWTLMFRVVRKCSKRALETSDSSPATDRSRMASPLAGPDDLNEQNAATTLGHTLFSFIVRIEQLLVNFKGVDFYQREECIKFLVDVHGYLPGSCAKLVIDYYMDYRLCFPTDLDWRANIETVLGAFFSDRAQPTPIRLHAIDAITDVYQVVDTMEEHKDPNLTIDFVAALLEDIGDEKDTAVLQELVAFAVAVAEKADHPLFEKVVDFLRGSITSDRLQSPLGSPPASRHELSRPTSSALPNTNLTQTPSNVVAKGFIQIFMKTMDKSTFKSLHMFKEILSIAKSHDCATDARISALKMLFRLRADWANRVFLMLFTESEGLAACLYRTAASLARKQAADETAHQQRLSRADDAPTSRLARSTSFGQGHPQPRHPVRTGSGVSRTLQRNHQMWMYPDPEALPEIASDNSSSRLVSVAEAEQEQEDNESVEKPAENGNGDVPESKAELDDVESSPRYRATLDIGTYLETVTKLLKNGTDWEVYSYILVHLPSQLTNQALFKGAIPEIKVLREVLCDLLKNNSFQEPPHSSGLRKADVAICLFQILNMVMGYHQHFLKADQDEIVRTFMQGIGSTWERTAKCCIHALSICCHEMPGSTSKSLMTILQKMSTIITQSHVAVHILEFLACLARLPDLYVNFREEEYRTVFAICFRYLQYVRDQPVKDTAVRTSYNSKSSTVITEHVVSESNVQPNTSDDLPQYVYALAYHVIIFWFLSLKLTDRAGQVSWITKNLISTDANGKEKMDEQAQVTLDFMQRVAYADVDESKADPTFNSENFGDILKKRWIVGQSLVTIEQATQGGWAQITKRQPSGTSCYIIQEKFNRPPAHQSPVSTDALRDARHSENNVVLPSHLLLQFTASIPQVADSTRPVPLPSDAVTDRAVKAFDRNFTVDGHKVGVIYIGENQTKEVEILANIMGSTDYTDLLSGLGTLTKLKGAEFNTQGLDRHADADGEYAFCWRDRVSEIVFHATTQMPTNLERDPQCIGKKQHIGNDFVNIIFNNSGHPFQFDTFPSEFNYVNIVITPESRLSFVATRFRTKENAKSAFYKVQVMSKPGFPEISPAAEPKIMSLEALPGFIRLLALNASVFSLVWANREGGEHVSSWRNRLREINRLKDKHGPKPPPTTTTSPPSTSAGLSVRDSVTSLRRSSVANFLINSSESNSQRSSVLSTAETEVGGGSEESIVDSLDFSRWA